MTEPTFLTHVRSRLALHPLATGSADGARPLLLLHGLGERTTGELPDACAGWPGPIWGLDLTGHGRSSRTPGGGYTAEVLMGDVDAALAHLGRCTVVGRGLGGYVGLLIAGARPELVAGVVVCDGPGLAGGGPSPHSPVVVAPPHPAMSADDPDPFALVELARDVRPDDYATTYVRQALQFSGLEAPVAVAAVVRPPWLAAVAAEPGVVSEPLSAALARFVALP